MFLRVSVRQTGILYVSCCASGGVVWGTPPKFYILTKKIFVFLCVFELWTSKTLVFLCVFEVWTSKTLVFLSVFGVWTSKSLGLASISGPFKNFDTSSTNQRVLSGLPSRIILRILPTR